MIIMLLLSQQPVDAPDVFSLFGDALLIYPWSEVSIIRKYIYPEPFQKRNKIEVIHCFNRVYCRQWVLGLPNRETPHTSLYVTVLRSWLPCFFSGLGLLRRIVLETKITNLFKVTSTMGLVSASFVPRPYHSNDIYQWHRPISLFLCNAKPSSII